MFFAAIMIVMYHLWINISPRSSAAYGSEQFVRYLCFIGVDLFFFASASVIGRYGVKNYGEYILQRFKSVYLRFIIFAVVAFFYGKWAITRLLKVVFAVELFEKGGGSFLWFLPAVFLLYFLLPVYDRVQKKYPVLTPVITALSWFLIGFAVTRLTSIRSIFIFYNRIPVALLGYYAGKQELLSKMKGQWKFLAGLLLTLAGGYLMRKIGYKPAISVPIRDMFYVVALPASVGFVMLFDMLPSGKIISSLSKCTLEMYAIQMIFGYDFTAYVYKLTKNPLATNILTIIFVVASAYICNWAFSLIKTRKVRN